MCGLAALLFAGERGNDLGDVPSEVLLGLVAKKSLRLGIDRDPERPRPPHALRHVHNRCTRRRADKIEGGRATETRPFLSAPSP